MSTSNNGHQKPKMSNSNPSSKSRTGIRLTRPEDWADSIGSLSVISALIFGFACAVLTNVQQPKNMTRSQTNYFAAFVVTLCLAIGMSFVGLAVSSIMYHNVRGFLDYDLQKHLKVYERKSYLIKNMAYYMIYISWASLIVSLVLYCWVFFSEFISYIATGITITLLLVGILMGGHLANMYARYNGDENIFNVMNPQRVNEIQAQTTAERLSFTSKELGDPQTSSEERDESTKV